MQEPAGRRPSPPFAGVDLRRQKGYPAKEAEERPAHEPAAGDPCPRCQSRDTKFCYYNNYNTSQPRHFCRSCRRYWTKGGSLRNVPVGGGTRSKSSSSSRAAPKNSKRRRVAPAADPAPRTDAASTADDVANTAPTPAPAPSTEAAAAVAAEEPAHAAPPVADGGFTDTSVGLGLGLTDVSDGGKELPDPGQFEWPSGCDLGSYWGTGVYADADPALFDLPLSP